MGLFDLYSKRQRRNRGDFPDVYQYEEVTDALRVQIVHIFSDAFGDPSDCYQSMAPNLMKMIHDALCREYGVFSIGREHQYNKSDPYHDVFRFVLTEPNVEHVLDAVELLARVVSNASEDPYFEQRCRPKSTAEQAISELNERFREHGFGFQYESGQIVRVDSQLIHREAIKPVLLFLQRERFSGANEEFLRAHEHYRHQRYKEAMNDALKSFESVMKAICDKRGWYYDPNSTAKKLLQVVFENELVPAPLQTHFASLRAGLESGVPTLRNKLSGHGQGSIPQSLPEHFVSYHLHLAASSILFLCECDEELE